MNTLPMTIIINGTAVRGQLRRTSRVSLGRHSRPVPEWLAELEGGMEGTGAPVAACIVLSEEDAAGVVKTPFDAGFWGGYWRQVLRVALARQQMQQPVFATASEVTYRIALPRKCGRGGCALESGHAGECARVTRAGDAGLEAAK